MPGRRNDKGEAASGGRAAISALPGRVDKAFIRLICGSWLSTIALALSRKYIDVPD